MKLHCVNSKRSLYRLFSPKNPGIINDPNVRDGLAVSCTAGVYFMWLFFILGEVEGNACLRREMSIQQLSVVCFPLS